MKAKLSLTPEEVKIFLIKGLTIEGYKVDPNTLKINLNTELDRYGDFHPVFTGAEVEIELGKNK